MAEPTRVLQIVTQMNRGGIESRLMDVYRDIDRDKIKFDFYTCRHEPGFFDEEIRSLGGIIYYNSSLNIRHLFHITKQFQMFHLQHPEYQIVHCHLNQWCGLILAGAKKAGVPIRIAHSHTSLEKSNLKNIAKNLIKCPVNRTATCKLAVSKKAGEWLYGKRAVANGEVKVWPNAIDCEKFRYNPQKRENMRANLNLGNSLTIIHVGNIRPEKNHVFLLQVFSELLKSKQDAKLVLVGADHMNNFVQEEAIKLGIADSTLFLGSRSDIPDLLQAGDVFVFPSLYEGFPGAVLEAEAAGLPCIISNSITDEVCLTDKILRMSNSVHPLKWAEKISQLAALERMDTTALIIAKEYDIKRLIGTISSGYLSCVI